MEQFRTLLTTPGRLIIGVDVGVGESYSMCSHAASKLCNRVGYHHASKCELMKAITNGSESKQAVEESCEAQG